MGKSVGFQRTYPSYRSSTLYKIPNVPRERLATATTTTVAYLTLYKIPNVPRERLATATTTTVAYLLFVSTPASRLLRLLIYIYTSTQEKTFVHLQRCRI